MGTNRNDILCHLLLWEGKAEHGQGARGCDQYLWIQTEEKRVPVWGSPNTGQFKTDRKTELYAARCHMWPTGKGSSRIWVSEEATDHQCLGPDPSLWSKHLGFNHAQTYKQPPGFSTKGRITSSSVLPFNKGAGGYSGKNFWWFRRQQAWGDTHLLLEEPPCPQWHPHWDTALSVPIPAAAHVALCTNGH